MIQNLELLNVINFRKKAFVLQFRQPPPPQRIHNFCKTK